MFNSFANVADLTPYTLEAAQINLEAKNDALAYGSDRSMLMDLNEHDRIDVFDFPHTSVTSRLNPVRIWDRSGQKCLQA